MTAITPEEHRRALDYAAQSLNFTVDRMGYGGLANAGQIRLQHIYVGKAVELATLRTLRDDFQLALDPVPVETPYDEPDQADWLLTKINGRELQVDMKSFHIFRTYQRQERTCETVNQRSTALVPIDQLRRHPKDIYIFATLLGNTVTQDPTTGIPILEDGAEICAMRWEHHGQVQGWEQIARGTPVYPYARTRTNNLGQSMQNLREIEELKSQAV